ncbi:MAG: hypothetical protein ACP5JL_05935, partial [bacterium]
MFRTAFFLIILCIILFFPAELALPQIGTDIRIELGINGLVRVGRWNPILVSISTFGIPFKGEIEIDIKEGSMILGNIRVTSLKSSVDIPIYSKRELLFLAPLSDMRYPIRVSVFSDDGRVVKMRDYDIKSLEMRWPIIGLIGNNSLPYAQRDVRVTMIDSELVSKKSFMIFDPLDLLIVGNPLERDVQENIEKWLGWGGNVIIGETRGFSLPVRLDTYPGRIDFQNLVIDSLDSEVVPLPSKGLISLLLFIYVLSFILVFYYIKRLFLIKILIAVILSLSFSIVLFNITSSSKSHSIVMTQFSLISAKGDNPFATIYNGTAVFSPYSISIKLNYHPQDMVFWVGGGREKNIAKATFIISQNDQEPNNILLDLSPDRKGILRGWGIERIDINARFSKDRTLYVENNSPYILRGAYLLFEGKYLYLGDIKRGETRFNMKRINLSTVETEGDKGRFFSWAKNSD